MNYTKHTLKKVELLFEEVGYIVRYEKGNFNSGYCVVEDRKIAIISKFFEVDGRISTLFDILDSITVEEAILSEKTAKFYKDVLKHKKKLAGEEEEENAEETKEETS